MANPWMDPEYAAAWDTGDRAPNPYRSRQVGVVLRLLDAQAPSRVLDVGCGPGAVARRILARRPDVQVVCLDGSPAMLDRARRTLVAYEARCHFVCARMEDPLPEEAGRDHDLVLAVQAVHHLDAPDKRAFFRRAWEALRPGGMLLLADRTSVDERLFLHYRALWNQARAHLDFEPLGEAYDWARHLAGLERNGDVPDFLEDQLVWLREAGFDPVDVFWRHANRVVFGGLKPV